MRLPILLGLLGASTACATPPPAGPPYSGPTYTRASVAGLTTEALAQRLLDPADAGTVQDHWVRGPLYATESLDGVHFTARPRPIAEDMCGRDSLYAVMTPVDPPNRRQDPPVRPERLMRQTLIALARNCEMPPGSHFARIGYRYVNLPSSGPPLTLADAMSILRWLAFARATAAGTEPLPFRLTCTGDGFACPADPRPLLAGLQLNRAITIDRAPFSPNTLCGAPRPETGDSVEVKIDGDPHEHVWEVRMRDMGSDHAEIAMSRTAPRDRVRC